MLGVEHDYLEVFVSTRCISQEVCTLLQARGCRGDFPSPRGGLGGLISPWLGDPRASAPRS